MGFCQKAPILSSCLKLLEGGFWSERLNLYSGTATRELEFSSLQKKIAGSNSSEKLRGTAAPLKFRSLLR